MGTEITRTQNPLGQLEENVIQNMLGEWDSEIFDLLMMPFWLNSVGESRKKSPHSYTIYSRLNTFLMGVS